MYVTYFLVTKKTSAEPMTEFPLVLFLAIRLVKYHEDLVFNKPSNPGKLSVEQYNTY